MYVRSQEDALRLFPQQYEVDDDRPQAAGVFTALMEAQAHGFPKDIPRDVALKWKAQAEAELAERRKMVAAYVQATAATAQSSATQPASGFGPLPSSQPTSPPPKSAAASFAGKRARPLRGPSQFSEPLPAPAWLKEIKPQFSLFKLSPPNVLAAEFKPTAQMFQFPAQFEVRGVLQTALCEGKLLILAMDERSAPSSDARPDLASEVINQRARLWSLDPAGQRPALFEAGLLPDNMTSFLLDKERLWVAGASVGCLDLKNHNFRQFGLREGLASGAFHSLAIAGGRLFATGDTFKLYSIESGSSQWQELRLPQAKLSAGTGYPSLVSGNSRCLGYVSGAGLLYEVHAATWTNLPEMPLLHCVAADASSFWFGGFDGLHRYDLGSGSFTNLRAPVNIQGLSHFSMGPYQYIGQPRIPEEAVTRIADSVQHFLTMLQKQRAQVHLDRAKRKDSVDPLHLDWRIPGHISALAHDGDFLWLGTDRYSISRVLLVHKPSLSLVGYCLVDGDVSSLTVTERDVWVGTSYGKTLLTRIEKQPLLSIPRSRWLSLAIDPDERMRLVNRMALRDRAMYAFYAGEDARVVELLGNVSPDKASLEEMFLLAFACDASGVDRPELARAWFERIVSRYPDSPWATASRQFLEASDEQHRVQQRQARLFATYDRNHGGVLDRAERSAMEQDPSFQREEKVGRDEQLDAQLRAIFKKYDRNGDGRLGRDELELLGLAVRMYSETSPQMLAGRTVLVAPLLTRDFPATDKLLGQYDTNKNGALDPAELKALANDVRKRR